MVFSDLIDMYLEKKKLYGAEAYKYISLLLEEAKIIHKHDWEQNPTKGNDHEQSWRAFKGKNFEKLIEYIIKDQIELFGLKLVMGSTLERNVSLSEPLSRVKRNISVDYGDLGLHLPDVDIVIYEPDSCVVIALLSTKVTLRERIAQTGYWKLKLSQCPLTKNIKVFFITLDEDGTLKKRILAKKGRAIVEVDTDGSYVLSQDKYEINSKVKYFESFIDDLQTLFSKRKQ